MCIYIYIYNFYFALHRLLRELIIIIILLLL